MLLCRAIRKTRMLLALVPFELPVAAHLGTLDAKIASYRSDPDRAPGAEILRSSAQQLSEAGDKQSARKILEFVFARELDEHKLVAANFLGLAEIRIAAGDTPGAVELLRRLVTVVGDPYEDMDSAAALLEKTGHNAEAIAFLDPLAKSTPWEPAFRVRLAKAQIAAGTNAEWRARHPGKNRWLGAESLRPACRSRVGSFWLRPRCGVWQRGIETSRR